MTKQRLLLSLALFVAHCSASTKFSAPTSFRVETTLPEQSTDESIQRGRILPKVASEQELVNISQASSSISPPAVQEEKAPRKGLIQKSTVASCISFLTGFGDILSFRRYGFYCNMMTGNTIRFGTALTELRLTDALLFGMVVTCYSLGIFLFRLVDLKTRPQIKEVVSGPPVATTASTTTPASSRSSCMVVVMPMILSLFMLVDVLVLRGGYPYMEYRGFVPLLSLAYGMLNAASVDALGGTVTHAMTGHVTKLGQALADRVAGSKKRWRKGTKTSCRVLAFFGLGLACGTISFNNVELWLGNIPPYTSLGVMYALIFLLHNISLPEQPTNDKNPFVAPPTPPIPPTPPNNTFTVVGNDEPSDITSDNEEDPMDIAMDGWTTVPTGPVPFQDGQD